MTTEPSLRVVPVGLTIATLMAMAILIWLGVWQLQRLAWKEALLAHVVALRTAVAQPLDTVLASKADPDLVRVKVTCDGLGSAPYLELYSIREGGAGVRLVSACRLPSGAFGSILVDRGFVSDQISARPTIDPSDQHPVEVVGVLRAPDRPTFVTPKNNLAGNHWYSRDLAAMARALGVTSPAPVTLMAETSTNPEWRALNPAPLPTEIANRHFEYALTWFGLAAALACVYAATLWKRWKG